VKSIYASIGSHASSNSMLIIVHTGDWFEFTK
jgi:hypothetical membrane protein